MSLDLELPTDLQSELAAEAAQLGLPLNEYAVRVLAGDSRTSVRNGAELIAYWQREGIVGSRADLTDSAAHARSSREQSQSRTRS